MAIKPTNSDLYPRAAKPERPNAPAEAAREAGATSTSPKPEIPKVKEATAPTTSVSPTASLVTAKQALEKPFKPRFRDQDFNAAQIKLAAEKLEALAHLRQKLTQPNKDERRCSAFIQGPRGSRISDVFLARAVDKYKEEKKKAETSPELASNIVIIGEDFTETQLMARRLLRSFEPSERKSAANDIETLDTLLPKKNNDKKPKIIFINTRNLEKIGTKTNLDAFYNYVGIDSLRYLYFDHAHQFVNGERGALLKTIIEKLNARNNDVQYEVVGSSHCDNEYQGKRISDYLGNKKYLGGPEQLSGSIVAPIKNKASGSTKIGTDLPEAYQPPILEEASATKIDLEVIDLGINADAIRAVLAEGDDEPKLKMQGPKTRKKWSAVIDYAHNPEYIKNTLVKIVKDKLEAANGKKQKILIRAYDIKAIELIVSALKEAELGASKKHIEVGWTHTTTKESAKEGASDKETNCYINSELDPSTAKPKIQTAEDRLDLLDKWGEKFEVLVHCKCLDGKEIPADHVINFYPATSNDNLEAILTPARTLPEDGELRDSEIGTDIWLLDIEKPSKTFLQDANDTFEAIKKRHLAEDAAEQRTVSDAGLNRLGKVNSRTSTPVTDLDSYWEIIANYGGNVEWLKFLDEKLIKTMDLVELKQTLESFLKEEPKKDEIISGIIQDFSSRNFETRLNALIDSFIFTYGKSYVDYSNPDEDIIAEQEEKLVNILRGLPSSDLNKRDIIEKLLFLNIHDLGSVIPAFPKITGIKNETEASERVAYLVKQEEIAEKAIETNPGWLDALENQFGKNYQALISSFIFENHWQDLFSDYTLTQTLEVLYGVSTTHAESKTEADLLFKNFTEYCKAKQPDNFSAYAWAKAMPEHLFFNEHLDPKQLKKEIVYINAHVSMNKNEAWLKLLNDSLGIPKDNEKERHAQLFADFLITQSPASFETPESLEAAVRELNGDSGSALLQAFVSHINKDQIKLKQEDLYKIFPEIFLLADVKPDKSNLDFLIPQLLVTLKTQANQEWLGLLEKSIKDTSLDSLLISFFKEKDQARLIKDQESLQSCILVLLGNQEASSMSQARAKTLFNHFFSFLANHQSITELSPQLSKRLLGELFDIDKYLNSPDLAKQECLRIAALKPVLNPNNNWTNLLVSANPDSTKAPKEAAIEVLADFIHEEHPTLLRSSSQTKAVLTLLLDINLNSPTNYTLEEAGFNKSGLLNEFVDWLLKNKPSLNPIQISRHLETNQSLFEPKLRIKTMTQAKAAISYTITEAKIKPHEAWIDDDNFFKYATKFLCGAEQKKTAFNDYDSLVQKLKTISGQAYNFRKPDKAKNDLFLEFHKFVQKTQSVDLFLSRSLFHSLFSLSDVIIDEKSATKAVLDILNAVKDRDYSSRFLKKPYFNTNEERAEYIAQFLYIDATTYPSFTDDETLKNTVDLLRGANIPVEAESKEAELLKSWVTKIKQEKSIPAITLFPYFPDLVTLSNELKNKNDKVKTLSHLIYPYILKIVSKAKLTRNEKWEKFILLRTPQIPLEVEGEADALMEIARIFNLFLTGQRPDILDSDHNVSEALKVLMGLNTSYKGSKDDAIQLINDLNEFFGEKDSGYYKISPFQLAKNLPELFSSTRADFETEVKAHMSPHFRTRNAYINGERETFSVVVPFYVPTESGRIKSFYLLTKVLLEIELGMSLPEIMEKLGFEKNRKKEFYTKPITDFINAISLNSQGDNDKGSKLIQQHLKQELINKGLTKKTLEEDLIINKLEQFCLGADANYQPKDRSTSFSYRIATDALAADAKALFGSGLETINTGIVWDLVLEYDHDILRGFLRVADPKDKTPNITCLEYSYDNATKQWNQTPKIIQNPEFPSYFEAAVNS